MSMDDEPQLIIIRKRRGDGEEDHHGGVWKLAFADFMTAMMAFFLVMWLINSTTKETKASIVQYFNPVQLVDSKPARKGLMDPKDSGQGASMQKTMNSDKSAEGGRVQNATEAEESLHKEPLKTLDKIASLDAPAGDMTAADPFADPFDRMDAASSPPQKGDQSPKRAEKDGAASRPNMRGASGQADNAAAISEAINATIRKELQAMHGVPKVEVKRVEDGVLISLTDDANFSMFDVGSIKPKPQLVRILQKVGSVIAKQPGTIEIAGHTDRRNYKSGSYDNWRLSSDRADIAYYMLMRGGLPAERVNRISGYADRRLKTPDSPLAPVNRRIEILLRDRD